MIRDIRSWSLLLTLLAATPAVAQEEMPSGDPATEAPAPVADDSGSVPYDPAADSMPVDEAAPADSAETPAADGSAPIDTAPTPEDATAEAQVETIPVETAEEPEEEAEPWQLYAGLDLVNTTVSTDAGNADSGMYRLRFGRKVFDQLAVEFQYGLDNGGGGAGEVPTDTYMGLFFVPSALLLDTVELHFPIGYAKTDVAVASQSGMAYGIDAELPLRTFGDEMPDLRFCLGWMIYSQGSAVGVYGANLGLRYDFTTASLGNPFGWIGDLDLWPFGDDDEAETAE